MVGGADSGVVAGGERALGEGAVGPGNLDRVTVESDPHPVDATHRGGGEDQLGDGQDLLLPSHLDERAGEVDHRRAAVHSGGLLRRTAADSGCNERPAIAQFSGRRRRASKIMSSANRMLVQRKPEGSRAR